MSTQVSAADVVSIDVNGYYIRIIPSLNRISENIIQALGIRWTTADGLAGVYWVRVDGVNYNFHSFNQLIHMCKHKGVAIPVSLHQYLHPVAAPELPIVVSELATVEKPDNHSRKFHSDLFGDLTVLTHDDGSLWFIGKEVAEKLGYTNTSKAISDHCKGGNETLLPTKGGMQTVKIIPERDVYRLVMKSKLPTAEKFEEFVVSEVLPSIRKTGGYGQIAAQQPAELTRKDLILLALEAEKEVEQLQIENQRLHKTKQQITAGREASVMGKLSRANAKVLRLEAQLQNATKAPEYQYATVLAIQSRLKHMKVSGLRLTFYCNQHGLVMRDIPDERFGVVHSYPAGAWKEVYQIDINKVLNREV